MKMPLNFVMIIALFITSSCSKKDGNTAAANQPASVVPVKTDVSMWLTQPDRSVLFQKQNIGLLFSTTANANPSIIVDTTQTYQTIDGFGYALTGGSASVLNNLSTPAGDALLKELFLTDTTHIGVSYLRISIGASDLSVAPFTYDEIDAGTTDEGLVKFTLDQEQTALIPILKRILALNPAIKILACPWTAPTWMKTNGSFVGGSLLAKYYDAYARYFIKYIQAMAAEGITIDAITPQNEPLNPGNNPSMMMQSSEEADFVKNYLGPQFQSAGIKTKIIVWDHNADHPDYPMAILADAVASPYIDGSAFHLYAGDISALSIVHNSYPAKNIYFTEQWTGAPGNFSSDLQWHMSNLIIGATRNWSRNVLEWNLATDPSYGPHTNGGCSTCMGALTIGSTITRNVSYYVIAHAAKFVRPGSVRIGSNIQGSLQNVAFKTPDGKKVLIVLNSGTAAQTFNIQFNSKRVSSTLNTGAVATYTW